jgi:hypothetical protein
MLQVSKIPKFNKDLAVMATTSSGDMEKMQMVSSGKPEIPEATK